MRNRDALARAAAALVLAVTASIAHASDEHGTDKCKIAIKGDSPVAAACSEGGVPAATKKMKELVRHAKAKGVKFVCDDCHKNPDDHALTDNATKDFERLLAATH